MQRGPQKTVVKFVQQADGAWKPVRVPVGEAPAPRAKPVREPAKPTKPAAPPKVSAAATGKKLSGLLGLARRKEVAADDWEFEAALPEISTPAAAKREKAAKAAAEAAAKEAEEVAARGFVLGQYVRCRDNGGQWVNGTVTCLSPLQVQPDGGVKGFDWDEVVAIECEFELGQRVRCRDKGGKWFNGSVTCLSPLEAQPDGGVKGFAYDEVVAIEEEAWAKPKQKRHKVVDWGDEQGWAKGEWDESVGEEASKAKNEKRKDEEWADWDAVACEQQAKKAKKVVIKVRDANDFALVYGNAQNAESDEEPSSTKKKSVSGGKGSLIGAKGGGKGVNPDQSYSGVVRLRHPLSGDLLIHCEPVTQAFKKPASIPYGDNPGGARVGSIIIFKVSVSDDGTPLAVDVRINGFDDEVEGAELFEPDEEEDEEEEAPKGKKGKAKGSGGKGKDKGKDNGKDKGKNKGGAKGKGIKGVSKGREKGKAGSGWDDWNNW